MYPRRRARLTGWGRLALALGAVGAAARGAETPREAGRIWTFTPFQSATFVADAESARLLNGLAEFSTRLLRWNDTTREPVFVANRVVKTAFLPYLAEWKGWNPTAPRLTSAVVIERISAGYRSLQSPRLIRLTIGADLVVGSLRPVDALGDRAVAVPVVVDNVRAQPVTLTLRTSGAAPLRTVQLQPHQALGFFLELNETAARSLVAEVDGRSKAIAVPWHRQNAATLRVKVLDETGSPTPARMYLTGADGEARVPDGTMPRIVAGDYGQPGAGDSYFHCAGTFTVELPAGVATIEAVKGLEYLPAHQAVNVVAGNGNSVELHLRRRAHLAESGWYSGDVHVHANLFAEKRIGPGDVLLVAQAEDLNVVNILPCNDPRTTLISDRQFFTGRPDAVSDREHIIYFNEEMRNDIFGHVGFLNLKSFVEPAYYGWAHSPFPYDYPGNYPQAAQAKAQGGVVTYVHPGLPSEFPVDIALGVADTIDAMSQNDEELTTALWYRLLNCGFRCPISAGTDSFLNIPAHLIPGAGRLYVHVGAPLTYAGWIDGYRRGRSFATNGPLLQFTVNGHEAGDELVEARGPVEVEVRGQAESNVPMTAVEIIVNGRPVRRIDAGADPRAIRVAEKIELPGSAWIALRVRGPGHRLVPNDRELYAHTSPVYVTIGGRPVASRDDALFFVAQIDALMAKMDERGVFANRAQRDEIAQRLHAGQAVYRKLAAAAAPEAP